MRWLVRVLNEWDELDDRVGQTRLRLDAAADEVRKYRELSQDAKSGACVSEPAIKAAAEELEKLLQRIHQAGFLGFGPIARQ